MDRGQRQGQNPPQQGQGRGRNQGQDAAQDEVQQPQAAPARVHSSPWQGDIDVSTRIGKSLWDEGIKPLKDDEHFSGMGKDVTQFLASVKKQAKKCHWMKILTFGQRNLLTQYGEITEDEVRAARDARDAADLEATTLAQVRPKINSQMMFHFVYDSLGLIPKKKISTKLDDIDEDGPLLLKMILAHTFVGTKASTFSIKERFYELNLKKFKWNVQVLNQHVREKQADLIAAGHAADATDVIISLFRAYNTSTNEEFKHCVTMWKNEWTSNTITTVEELMSKADAKYAELKDLNQWGRRGYKEEQIVALSAKMHTTMTKKDGDKSSSKNKDQQRQSNVPKWKYDRSLSSTTTYKKNNKVYYWCNGPGHDCRGMWVVHKPGECTTAKAELKANTNKDCNKFDAKALITELQSKGLSQDEVDSKMEAIIAILED